MRQSLRAASWWPAAGLCCPVPSLGLSAIPASCTHLCSSLATFPRLHTATVFITLQPWLTTCTTVSGEEGPGWCGRLLIRARAWHRPGAAGTARLLSPPPARSRNPVVPTLTAVGVDRAATRPPAGGHDGGHPSSQQRYRAPPSDAGGVGADGEQVGEGGMWGVARGMWKIGWGTATLHAPGPHQVGILTYRHLSGSQARELQDSSAGHYCCTGVDGALHSPLLSSPCTTQHRVCVPHPTRTCRRAAVPFPIGPGSLLTKPSIASAVAPATSLSNGLVRGWRSAPTPSISAVG